jgi:hypothetical protein
MGWNNERYPRTNKDWSFIGFGISHSRFSDFQISFLDLGYPIGTVQWDLFQVFWNVPGISLKPQKIPLGYQAPGHIPCLSLRYPIDIPKHADLS